MTKKSFNELFEDLIIKLELKDEKIYSHEYKFAIPTVFSKDELKTFSVKAVFIQNLWRSIFIAMIFLILLLLLNILKYLITPYKVDLLFLIGNSIPLFIILLIVFLILFFSELIRIFHIKRTIGKNFDEYDFYVSTCQNVLEHELVHIKLHKDFLGTDLAWDEWKAFFYNAKLDLEVDEFLNKKSFPYRYNLFVIKFGKVFKII